MRWGRSPRAAQLTKSEGRRGGGPDSETMFGAVGGARALEPSRTFPGGRWSWLPLGHRKLEHGQRLDALSV